MLEKYTFLEILYEGKYLKKETSNSSLLGSDKEFYKFINWCFKRYRLVSVYNLTFKMNLTSFELLLYALPFR